MHKQVARFHSQVVGRERGATAVEYGLMVALIAIIIVAVALLGTNLSNIFQNTANSV